jgi:hypothetical protein
MKTNLGTKTLALLLPVLLASSDSRAANIMFTFAQITGAGMDLFSTTTDKTGLISNSSNVYFALGYVSSSFSFSGKTRDDLLGAITYISSSSSSWFGVGSAEAASGGKVDVIFNGGGNGYDTTALGWAGQKLVAVISEGVNPLGGTILGSTPIAIVRGATGWDSILSTDGAPNPTTQALNVINFDVLLGTLTSNAGNLNSAGSVKFDVITAVPEPGSGTLLMIGVAGLLALRRMRKV